MERWLVTGAGRGIGLEIAHQLLKRGDAVVATVRDKAAANILAKDLNAGDRLQILELDVRDGAAIHTAAKTVDGALDVIVNNAGIIGPKRQSALDMDFDGFLDTLAVNTVGPLRIAQAFMPQLSRGTRPRLVTISSQMGALSSASSDHVAYRVSKAAANKVAQCLATDLAPKGIIAITVHPGWVQTDMGGRGAAVPVVESAAGLIRMIDGLTPKLAGSFLDYRGKPVEW